ncbi:hypothetical protein WR25_15734 [Diploscapter pachys]|uniref:MOSC domain-containing protein n=1 Tax=Diploscapter pachys TaxID=2018661 RepID=A0A2A2J3D7_9BILA|nr:hypothetical protein WR25_15734 [Diploscapter pachys]
MLPEVGENPKLLVGLAAATFLTYEGIKCLQKHLEKKRNAEFVPIGTVKSLHLYPIKSCKGHDVFSFFCSPTGPVSGDLKDRHFMVIDGKTGQFYTARQKPQLVLLESSFEGDLVAVKTPDNRTTHIDLSVVRKTNDVRQAFLHQKLRTDGLDCGEDIAAFLCDFIGEPDTRLIMFEPGMFTERTSVASENWWNNPVAYADLAPYLICTQASLDDLNSKLETKVTNVNFRPVIVVDKCAAWDEDKWAEIRIGGAELQCYKPCVLTTVNPETGVMAKDQQPLKKLREFRLAPEGKMRDEFKQSPIFGVNAGTNLTGHIHVGQTVYARYKPSAF